MLDAAHEGAVDLQQVQRQVAQVGIGGEATAEIIQRHPQATPAQALDPAGGAAQFGQGDHLGDLQAQAGSRQAMGVQQLVEQVMELRVEQRRGAEVDVDLAQLHLMARVGGQPLAVAAQHPAVDLAEEAVAFGGGEELPGRHPLAGLWIAVAQQDLVVEALLAPLQRPHRLVEQLEVLLLDGLAQTRDPLQLALVLDQRAIGRVEQVHAVAPLGLGHAAGVVRPVQRLLPVAHAGLQLQHTDAHAQAEWPPAVTEDEFLDRLAQPLRLRQRLVALTTGEQHGELVAADARQFGLARQAAEQVAGQLAQQLVAGRVTAEIVDLLELVQIEEQQVTETPATALQAALQQALQLAAVDQPGERVVRRLACQALLQGTPLAEVDDYALDTVLAALLVQRQVHPAALAVGGLQLHLATGGRLRFAQLAAQALPVTGRQQALDRLGLEQLGSGLGAAEQAQETGVGLQQQTLAVAAEDALGGVAEQPAILLQIDDGLLARGQQRLAHIVQLAAIEHAEEEHRDHRQPGMQQIEPEIARHHPGAAQREHQHEQDGGAPEQREPAGIGPSQVQREQGQAELEQAGQQHHQVDRLGRAMAPAADLDPDQGGSMRGDQQVAQQARQALVQA